MALRGADTGLQRQQCFPSSAWDFSPLSSVSLKNEAAYPCSLDSRTLSPTSYKSVTSFMWWKQEFDYCVLFFKQRWLISKFPWERKGGNIWLLLLLLLAVGIQSVHPGESISLLEGKLPSLCLHHFCNILSSKTLQDSHLHLWVSRDFLDLQFMPAAWCCAEVQWGCQWACV